jgi:hypothetical protein
LAQSFSILIIKNLMIMRTTSQQPNTNPDPTQPGHGNNDPHKNDPTRISPQNDPSKADPTRINNPDQPKPNNPPTPPSTPSPANKVTLIF